MTKLKVKVAKVLKSLSFHRNVKKVWKASTSFFASFTLMTLQLVTVCIQNCKKKKFWIKKNSLKNIFFEENLSLNSIIINLKSVKNKTKINQTFVKIKMESIFYIKIWKVTICILKQKQIKESLKVFVEFWSLYLKLSLDDNFCNMIPTSPPFVSF